jgi:hypothetical protein
MNFKAILPGLRCRRGVRIRVLLCCIDVEFASCGDANMLDHLTETIGSVNESPRNGHFDGNEDVTEAGAETYNRTILSKTTVLANPQSNLSVGIGSESRTSSLMI